MVATPVISSDVHITMLDVAEHDIAAQARQARIDRLQQKMTDTFICISPVIFMDVKCSSLCIRYLDCEENFHTVTFLPDEKQLKRIMVSVQGGGNISMAALQWCKNRNIAVHMLNRDLTANILYHEKQQTSLKRRQFTLSDAERFQMTRETVTAKLHASLNTLDYIRSVLPGKIDTIAGMQQSIADKLAWLEMDTIAAAYHSVARMRQVEGIAAKEYWACFEGMPINFVASEKARIPVNWKCYPGRHNGKSSPKNATDPLNAMLNYAYAIAISLLREAIVTRGLDAYAGYYHVDKQGRESLLYDLIEWVRADIDRCVLDIMLSKKLHKGDFVLMLDGQVQVSNELAQHIALTVANTLLHTAKDRYEGVIDWYLAWLKSEQTCSVSDDESEEYEYDEL
jgi:CRISPR-associated protein Cas1